MKKSLTLLFLVCALLAVVTFPSCKKKGGPMEQAGKAVDKAAQKTGDAVENAGDAVKETVDDAVEDK